MPKKDSDILIVKLKKDDYKATPSPFVARGHGFEIQFKNLAEDTVEVDLRGVPVHAQSLPLAAGASGSVFVNADAKPAVYPYKAHVLVPRAVRVRSGSPPPPPRRVAVKGSTPPRIIVDA